MPSLATATRLAQQLRRAGFETYLAGGCVRDMLLGRTPFDYDIATAASPADITALFPDTVPVGAAFGVVRVLAEDGAYEVATFRTEGPYLDGRRPSSVRYATAREDVARRDFTVNGLLYDPDTAQILDHVGGRPDLEAGLIRTIGDPAVRFDEDRLRMLRAVRFAAQLGFALAPDLPEAIRRRAGQITEVSPERIRDEMVRMFTGPDPARALALLHETGLLAAVLPEVEAEVGVAQPPAFHPEGDVFRHTCLALAQLRAPSATLAMATLLHDVGKPETFERADDRIRFSGHDERGAAVARRVMERLRFPRRAVDRVAALVGRHMVFKDVKHMRPATLRRLVADPAFPELLELHRADVQASHGDLSAYTAARDFVEHLAERPPVPPPLITGDDVLAMGVAPGPAVGRVLRSVETARLNDEIHTRAEALALLCRLLGAAKEI